MLRSALTDEAVVEKARRNVAATQKFRWVMLGYATLFLGLSGYFTLVGVRRIEGLDTEQLRMGFVYGLALAVVWTSFGVLGGICLGKFLAGVSSDVRQQELLISYHDRLRDLGQLPGERSGEQDGAANVSQPIRSETNRTSSAAGSRR